MLIRQFLRILRNWAGSTSNTSIFESFVVIRMIPYCSNAIFENFLSIMFDYYYLNALTREILFCVEASPGSFFEQKLRHYTRWTVVQLRGVSPPSKGPPLNRTLGPGVHGKIWPRKILWPFSLIKWTPSNGPPIIGLFGPFWAEARAQWTGGGSSLIWSNLRPAKVCHQSALRGGQDLTPAIFFSNIYLFNLLNG